MLERISSWIDKKRSGHHQKSLQSMINRLNEWDYNLKDSFATAGFLKNMVNEAISNLDDVVVRNIQPEEMPDELVQFCRNRTDDQVPPPTVSIFFYNKYNMTVYNPQAGALKFILNPSDYKKKPILVSGYGEGFDEYAPNNTDIKQNLGLMGKTIAAVAIHELLQH